MKAEERLGAILAGRGMRIALAESCTGGLISGRITDVAGASDYFEAGVVTYSNRAKEKFLDRAPRSARRQGIGERGGGREDGRGGEAGHGRRHRACGHGHRRPGRRQRPRSRWEPCTSGSPSEGKDHGATASFRRGPRCCSKPDGGGGTQARARFSGGIGADESISGLEIPGRDRRLSDERASTVWQSGRRDVRWVRKRGHPHHGQILGRD